MAAILIFQIVISNMFSIISSSQLLVPWTLDIGYYSFLCLVP